MYVFTNTIGSKDFIKVIELNCIRNKQIEVILFQIIRCTELGLVAEWQKLTVSFEIIWKLKPFSLNLRGP